MYVKDYLQRKGFTCEFKYNTNRDTVMNWDFHSTNPKIVTWGSAKGLQFKDVFIPGCEVDFDPEQRIPLYIAMTRSSERLYIGYSGRLSSFFPSLSSSLYNSFGADEMI